MKLKDLIESNNTGLDAIKRAPIVDYDTGVRCLRIGDISNNRPFNEWGYTEVEDNNYNKFQLKTGDIIVARTGATIGVNKYIDKDYKSVYNNGLIRIRVKQENNPKYVYYLLQSTNYKNFIKTISMGTSTQPNMQMNDLLNLEVPDFDKPKQDKIVKILGKIDDKIELNNEINNNLYELSQKIYNQWFVDFEYPISEGETYKSHCGNFIEVDGMVIPEGFKVCKLDEICDCQNGHAFYKEGYDDSGLMVIDLGNVSLQGNFIYTNADKYINKNRIPNEKFIVKKDDLVMIMTDRKATMDLLGKTAKIYENKEFALNQRIYRIRPTINVNYVYSFLNSNSTLNKLKGVALGSVQKYINTDHINDLKIVVPSVEIMGEYSKAVDPIFKQMEENILENRNLEIIRDTLLPKLMNGEIDLDNIEI